MYSAHHKTFRSVPLFILYRSVHYLNCKLLCALSRAVCLNRKYWGTYTGVSITFIFRPKLWYWTAFKYYLDCSESEDAKNNPVTTHGSRGVVVSLKRVQPSHSMSPLYFDCWFVKFTRTYRVVCTTRYLLNLTSKKVPTDVIKHKFSGERISLIEFVLRYWKCYLPPYRTHKFAVEKQILGGRSCRGFGAWKTPSYTTYSLLLREHILYMHDSLLLNMKIAMFAKLALLLTQLHNNHRQFPFLFVLRCEARRVQDLKG